MRIATTEEIAAFEMLASLLEREHTQRLATVLERDHALHAVERELASAVSIVNALVGGSAARALSDRREILETGHAARLSLNEIGQCIDTSHERVEDALETLSVAGFHWKWSARAKAADARETNHVSNAGSVLQHSRVFVAFAHDQLPPAIVIVQSFCRSGQSSGIVRLS